MQGAAGLQETAIVFAKIGGLGTGEAEGFPTAKVLCSPRNALSRDGVRMIDYTGLNQKLKEQKITLDTVSSIVGSASGGMGSWGGMGGRGQRQNDNADGGERPGGMGGRGGWGAQPGGTDGNGNAMPTPPEFDGEMPDPGNMPAPPDMGTMPPDMNDTRPGMDGETPDPSQLPQGMGGGNMRRDEMPDAMQNAAEEAAELAIEEPVPTRLQPVSPSAWVMLAACAAALVLGILIAVKYRQ